MVGDKNNMIHLHASKTFTEDLNKAGCVLAAAGKGSAGWHWHVHRVTLLRKKCVIAMDEVSRYALVFVGLKKVDFAEFEEVLVSRILAEANWLCDLPYSDSNERLLAAIEQKCSRVVFSQGLDRSVQAHIRQASELMEIVAKYQVGRLPETVEEEFALGSRINDTWRTCGKGGKYFSPLERWRESMLVLIAPPAKANIVNLADYRKKQGR